MTSSSKASYSSWEIFPVYPMSEAKYWLSVYLRRDSSSMPTPSILSRFSMIAIRVSSLTSDASTVGINFWKLFRLMA